MTTINNFSPARFWSVTTRDAALNWKTHLAHLLELAGTLLAGLLIIIITEKTHESTSFVSIADTFYSWFALVLTMGGMIAGVNPNYGSQQYLSDLTKAFFKDFNTSAPLSRYQRYMQSIFVSNLCASYKASRNGIANEALAAIYTTLKDMEKKFEKTSSTDKLTESHYTQLYLSIKQALAVNQ